MLAGYSFSRHQNPQWLPNPMSQTSVSQSVIVSFSGAVLSWKINFFSLRRKNIEHIFTFGNNLWVFTYGAQVFLQPAVYYRLVMLLCGHDSLFMHWAVHPIWWRRHNVMHILLASKHLGCLSMSISSLSQWICMLSTFTTDFSCVELCVLCTA